MGKKKCLTVEERARIDVYCSEGLSCRAIARKINRSDHCVSNYLKNPSSYSKNYKGNTSSALTLRETRSILRIASNSALSAAKIREKANVKASLSTVKRTIRHSKHLKRLKLKKKPPLNDARKKQRLCFAKEHMSWDVQNGMTTNDWRKVIFSDEKKFNLDGPDGYNYYFHDLRKEERFLNRHHSREGGVMVWGSISFYGAIELVVQDTKMTGKTYKALLESVFPKISEVFGPIPWIFQQDNAPIHTAREVKSFIANQNVHLLPWPPYSPDLNIIENVWGWLTRKVYEGGKQYDDKEALIHGIKLAWSEISLDYLESLYKSLKDRIFEVILKAGGSTHY